MNDKKNIVVCIKDVIKTSGDGLITCIDYGNRCLCGMVYEMSYIPITNFGYAMISRNGIWICSMGKQLFESSFISIEEWRDKQLNMLL